MNKLIISSSIALSLLSITPALAQTVNGSVNATVQSSPASVSVSANVSAKITTAKQKADQEIQRRIQKLTDLSTKVQGMAKVSAEAKASLASAVQSQISELTSLQVKIDADTDTATLKTDIQSIAKSYRIFMLVIPQAMIEVASDKIQTATAQFTSLSTKLQGRIAAGQAAGKDTTSVSASLTDMNAKIADANVQAAAAVSHVQGLQPDNGDKTVMAANDAALKQSRADLKIAQSDLEAARQDAKSIVQTVQSWKLGASASSTVSTQ